MSNSEEDREALEEVREELTELVFVPGGALEGDSTILLGLVPLHSIFDATDRQGRAKDPKVPFAFSGMWGQCQGSGARVERSHLQGVKG